MAGGSTERELRGFSARGLIPLPIMLILWALVPIVPLIFLGLNRIVAHPLRVISLLLTMLTLLLVGNGLRTAHLEAPFTLNRRSPTAKHHRA